MPTPVDATNRARFEDKLVAVAVPNASETLHQSVNEALYLMNQDGPEPPKNSALDAAASSSDPNNRGTTPNVLTEVPITQALIPAVERIRMFGAASIDLAFVAAGPSPTPPSSTATNPGTPRPESYWSAKPEPP